MALTASGVAHLSWGSDSHAAEPADIQKILEVAANWHETMTVDKIRAYHHGEHYMASLPSNHAW